MPLKIANISLWIPTRNSYSAGALAMVFTLCRLIASNRLPRVKDFKHPYWDINSDMEETSTLTMTGAFLLIDNSRVVGITVTTSCLGDEQKSAVTADRYQA